MMSKEDELSQNLREYYLREERLLESKLNGITFKMSNVRISMDEESSVLSEDSENEMYFTSDDLNSTYLYYEELWQELIDWRKKLITLIQKHKSLKLELKNAHSLRIKRKLLRKEIRELRVTIHREKRALQYIESFALDAIIMVAKNAVEIAQLEDTLPRFKKNLEIEESNTKEIEDYYLLKKVNIYVN